MNSTTAIADQTLSGASVVSEKDSLKDSKLRKVCADFESIFVQYILKSGRQTLPDNGLLGNSQGSKIYKSMMAESLARSVSKGQGTGLGQLLYNQLKGSARPESSISELI